MAAPKYTDRILAQNVRTLALKEIEKVLQADYEDKEFRKAVLLKIAPTLLPRLNEHTGEEGESIKISIEVSPEIAEKQKLYAAPHDPEGNSQGQSQV